MTGFRLFVIALSLAAVARPCEAQPPISSRVYASGFNFPVAFVQDPADRAVQFVVEQTGRIRVVRNGSVLPADFLDLSNVITAGGERGLLGMAFAPDASSGRFFVNFTNADGNTVIARFRRSDDPLIADAGSRFDLRWGGAGRPALITQPYPNHNGGNLVFGPDGYLYIGLGDGGSANDPENRAQNPSELLGKMLRVDINVPDDDPVGYTIPPDNPFVAAGANVRPEIWSFGLRNPWRYTFDDPARGGTGALVIGDVGQDLWEEVDYQPAGRGGLNYGWRNREGAHSNVTSLAPPLQPLVEPIVEYDHRTGQAIAGGFVYRGNELGVPYRGRYFFADFSVGRVWSVGLMVHPITRETFAVSLKEHTVDLGGNTLGNVSSFGVDAAGELYVVDYSNGKILKVVRSNARQTGDANGTGPVRLLPGRRR